MKETYWEGDLKHTTISGSQLRYLRSGSGRPIVLLHTLRTQLDPFEKVVPDLAKCFTIYAPDYPGHGYYEAPVSIERGGRKAHPV